MGEERIPSALAGVDNAATPLFVAPFALLIVADEKLSRQRVISLGVGFAGVLICLQPWKGLGSTDVLGQVACLSAAACYGVAIPWTRRAFRGRSVPVTVLAAGQVGIAAVELGIVVGVGALLGLVPAPHATSSGVLSLVTLGVVGTGLAYPLLLRADPRPRGGRCLDGDLSDAAGRRAAGGLAAGRDADLAGAGRGRARHRRGGDRGPAAAQTQASTSCFSTDVKKPRPSVPGPVRSSTACSGWGISPTTVPASLVMPAMSSTLPLGLTPT